MSKTTTTTTAFHYCQWCGHAFENPPSAPHPDTLRLEKLAGMICMDEQGLFYGSMPVDELRAWIDKQEVKP